MKQVWKFPLGDERISKIQMPKNAEILCVHEQFREAFLWALVNPENEKVDRTFQTFGTGDDIKLNVGKYHYIGTYFLDAGNYVFHVFESGKW